MSHVNLRVQENSVDGQNIGAWGLQDIGGREE